MPTNKCVHNWRCSRFTSALNAGVIWPPFSANTTSTPLAPKQQEENTPLSCFDNPTHLIHPHRYSQWGNNFITPARTVQSSNRGVSSAVTTVKLSSRDTSHLHQRREAADNVMRQLRAPWVWAELLLYTSRCVETWRVRGLGDCVVCNTNRQQATLNPWRRGLQLTGEEAVTQPKCCTEIYIPAVYTNQNVEWVRLNLNSVKSVATTCKVFLSESHWVEREGEGNDKNNEQNKVTVRQQQIFIFI